MKTLTDLKFHALCLAAAVAVSLPFLMPSEVLAHTSTPAMCSFTDGVPATAACLNNSFAHIHNSMNSLKDANLSSSAAISHSKLATPALLPKAWAISDTGPCDGAAAVDTVTCTLGDSAKVTSIKSSGTAGTYRVTLSYNPTDTHFAILVTPLTTQNYCIVKTLANSAPHFLVECRTDAGVLTNGNFSFLVMDT